ncbi:MAG: hypothetical protein GF317_08000 [Candidatus Lokiarchaeota archaeon]|nr:hypothetical protein [Candidatus Lokiarchaeota archaeon]MBD3199655.1 hypothetical protein [Candidatus Lokiarchaeota archaeon]
MTSKFHIQIRSGELKEDNRKRIHSITNPTNSHQPEIKIQLPVAYKGPNVNSEEIYYTPEHYYVAAISGCFFTTFSVVSSMSNFSYISLEIQAIGYMKEIEDEKIMDKIKQTITLTISSSKYEKKARKLLEITENRCPLVKSVKTRIENTYEILTK